MSDPRKTPLPALIVYTSRTGRTDRAAQALKVHLEWRNYETEVVKLGNGADPKDLSAYKLVIFGCPESGIPRIAPRPDPRLMAYIESLPPLDGRKVAAFVVEPFPTKNGAVKRIEEALIAKGADVVATDSFVALNPERDVSDLAAECMIRVFR